MTVCSQCGQIEMMAITDICYECKVENDTALEDYVEEEDDTALEDYVEEEDECWECGELIIDCVC